MKISECRIHGGQEGKKIIEEDGIERVGPSLYLLRQDELPLMMFGHEALHVEQGHFPRE